MNRSDITGKGFEDGPARSRLPQGPNQVGLSHNRKIEGEI